MFNNLVKLNFSMKNILSQFPKPGLQLRRVIIICSIKSK